jgi:hypothetical protein
LVLSVLLSLFGCTPAQSEPADTAAAVLVSGGLVSPDGLFYDVYDNGEVTITGRRDGTRELIVPDEIDSHPVTAIGEEAFAADGYLVYVKLGANLRTIGENAFFECKSLANLDLSGAKYILDEAFSSCENLRSVVITKNTTYVGKKVFMECKSTLKIYCEASEAEASNFDSEWNYSYDYLDVTWNYEITNN